MSNDFKNCIMAPYALAHDLRAKGYNKPVHYVRECPQDRWYYFTRTGKMRTVLASGGIWVNDWLTGKMRRIR